MRFKVIFMENTNKFKVNVLIDSSTEIILPENPDQHVFYPIPAQGRDEIAEKIETLLSEYSDEQERLIQIFNDIKVLHDEKRTLITELRRKINPEIFNICEEFRNEYPEYFLL